MWVISADVGQEDVPELCERFAAFLATTDVGVVDCDVGAISRPDAATIGALARLQLTARRHGRGIQLHRAQRRLVELILFTGLGGVLPLAGGGLSLEPGREAEEGEEALHVEEVVDPPDAPV
jgi:ABC-type transporter Mla MlaB component